MKRSSSTTSVPIFAESRYSNYQVCGISEPMAFKQIRDNGLGDEGRCRETAGVMDVWRHAHPSG